MEVIISKLIKLNSAAGSIQYTNVAVEFKDEKEAKMTAVAKKHWTQWLKCTGWIDNTDNLGAIDFAKWILWCEFFEVYIVMTNYRMDHIQSHLWKSLALSDINDGKDCIG